MNTENRESNILSFNPSQENQPESWNRTLLHQQAIERLAWHQFNDDLKIALAAGDSFDLDRLMNKLNEDGASSSLLKLIEGLYDHREEYGLSDAGSSDHESFTAAISAAGTLRQQYIPGSNQKLSVWQQRLKNLSIAGTAFLDQWEQMIPGREREAYIGRERAKWRQYGQDFAQVPGTADIVARRLSFLDAAQTRLSQGRAVPPQKKAA